jgi:hypothetical protein
MGEFNSPLQTTREMKEEVFIQHTHDLEDQQKTWSTNTNDRRHLDALKDIHELIQKARSEFARGGVNGDSYLQDALIKIADTTGVTRLAN